MDPEKGGEESPEPRVDRAGSTEMSTVHVRHLLKIYWIYWPSMWGFCNKKKLQIDNYIILHFSSLLSRTSRTQSGKLAVTKSIRPLHEGKSSSSSTCWWRAENIFLVWCTEIFSPNSVAGPSLDSNHSPRHPEQCQHEHSSRLPEQGLHHKEAGRKKERKKKQYGLKHAPSRCEVLWKSHFSSRISKRRGLR